MLVIVFKRDDWVFVHWENADADVEEDDDEGALGGSDCFRPAHLPRPRAANPFPPDVVATQTALFNSAPNASKERGIS